MQLFADGRQMVMAAFLVAMAVALHVFEALVLPVSPLPGVKLGLVNIVMVICLYIFPVRLCFFVLAVRLILSGLLSGTAFSAAFLIGGSGALASFVAMVFVKKLDGVSPLGVSIAGAAVHNIVQIIAAAVIISSSALFYYMPLAIIVSIPIGFLTGFVARSGIGILQDERVSR